MPELSRFFGHASYGGKKAVFNIRTLAMAEGSLPPRARGLIIEWASLHQQELLNAWDALRAGQSPEKIAPLE